MTLPEPPEKRRERYAGGLDRRSQIPQRCSITERPESVEKRDHIGHWKGDKVTGAAHEHAIITLVERKSGFTVVTKECRKTSKHVSATTINRPEPIASRLKTITFINGKEFEGHRQVDESLGSTADLADPFAS